ncbi:hypothetical protein HMPREF1572_01216 [Gardnerella vaginalis JCP7275]|nr:hypothetical protein HMPREF1572_01216 [Gardnerella vaginalis JCP7275]
MNKDYPLPHASELLSNTLPSNTRIVKVVGAILHDDLSFTFPF